MRHIELTLTFTDDSGATRHEVRSVDTLYSPDNAGERRAANMLFVDLQVTVGKQIEPKHNAVAREWLRSPGRPSRIEQYFNIRNSQAIWFELANLIMGAEGDLILSHAYKAIEPSQEPSFDDDEAMNNFHYIHERKMAFLNQAVQALIKVQDLVNRLLHESLGGDLVNTSKASWERTQLTRENVEKGLKTKRIAGSISQNDHDVIITALEMPENASNADVARKYRNRLAHHVRPSVDYAMFFSHVESRIGDDVTDQAGTVVGKRHLLHVSPPPQYRFEELFAANSDYLDAVVEMLQELSEVEELRS
jgi:hypothetical protein